MCIESGFSEAEVLASFDSDPVIEDMVAEHVRHLSEAVPQLVDLSGAYEL